jgi:DNA polymerase-3 subunit epsilon
VTLDMDKCWTKHDLCVLDVETLGLNPEDGVCEIAAVRFVDGLIVSSLSVGSLVNPGKLIPAEAAAIHRIRDEDVAAAPSLARLAPELFRAAHGAVPVAYCADFDRGFIHHAITGADCAAFDPAFEQWLDPLVIVRDVDRFTPGKGRHKLEAACARRGVQIDGAHRALPDATACGQLLFRMLERGEIKPCPLGKLLEHIGKRKRVQEADFQAWRSRQPKQEGAPV